MDRVVTVHYFEYSSSYYFEGEQHDFWEFVYVDKGEVDVLAGRQSSCAWAAGNLLHTPAGRVPRAARHGQLRAEPGRRELLLRRRRPRRAWARGPIPWAKRSARSSAASWPRRSAPLQTPLDDPDDYGAGAPSGRPAGRGAARRGVYGGAAHTPAARRRAGAQRQRARWRPQSRNEVFLRVDAYLAERLSQTLTLDRICRDNLVGRSRLQQIFHAETGGGVMEYFGRRKIEAAKEMIRRDDGNFTEIANRLGYQSIYYFSRHFKKVTGMTPSEYASGVRALAAKTKPGGG